MNRITSWFADSPLVTATWIDWVDIGLLAVVIYQVLRFMRGTRALQSLLGLVLVVALYVVSDLIGLVTVHWVLDNVFVYLVLALLILFQEDIRLALARAGGTIFQRSEHRPSDAAVMEEVIKAVFALGHRKIGALIVIERQANLEPYTEGAHPVDALVSTELLQSIFHPSSPLHDGAIVISNQRVVAAGVFLPISLAKEISRSFGTRHRAAIGISEATDGLCVVVSEERGTVSLVQGGEIIPVADHNDLRQRLVEHLGAGSGPAEPEPTPATGAAGG